MSQKRKNQTTHSGVQPPKGAALAGSAAVTRKSPGSSGGAADTTPPSRQAPNERPDANVALAPGYKSSNSPFFAPVRNAPISARV